MFGKYTKAIWTFLTIAGIAITAVVAATTAGVNLGLSPVVVAWVAIAGAVIGPTLAALFPNANQPTLSAGQAVVNKADIPAGTPTVVEHKP